MIEIIFIKSYNFIIWSLTCNRNCQNLISIDILKKKKSKKIFWFSSFFKTRHVLSDLCHSLLLYFQQKHCIFQGFHPLSRPCPEMKKQEISSPQFLVSLFSLQGFVKPNQQCVCFNLDWFIVLHIYWCIALPVRKWSLSGKQGLLRGGAGRAVALPLFCLSWFLGSRWHG